MSPLLNGSWLPFRKSLGCSRYRRSTRSSCPKGRGHSGSNLSRVHDDQVPSPAKTLIRHLHCAQPNVVDGRHIPAAMVKTPGRPTLRMQSSGDRCHECRAERRCRCLSNRIAASRGNRARGIAANYDVQFHAPRLAALNPHGPAIMY